MRHPIDRGLNGGMIRALFRIALLAVGCASNPAGQHAPPGAPASQPASRPAAPSSFAERPKPGTEATCSVTGDHFTVADATPYSEHEGRFYVFCCPECKEDFDADPAKYAGR